MQNFVDDVSETCLAVGSSTTNRSRYLKQSVSTYLVSYNQRSAACYKLILEGCVWGGCSLGLLHYTSNIYTSESQNILALTVHWHHSGTRRVIFSKYCSDHRP